MSTILWNQTGQRFFETGIDKAAIFVDNNAPVPWNGLTNVDMNSTIESKIPLYLDGVKYGTKTVLREHTGELSAYTYPDELLVFEGLQSVTLGMFYDEQPTSKTFNLTYRTTIGNDVDGVSLGYKIHLLYNVSIVPTSRSFATISQDLDPDVFTWEYSATPIKTPGYRPLSHIEVDSRKTPNFVLTSFENLLYGTPSTDGSLPEPAELKTQFEEWENLAFTGFFPSLSTYPSTYLFPTED